MHTVDDLLAGLMDDDWRVRHEVVDRLIARGREDGRTAPVLIDAATNDNSWEVRDAVIMRLHEFDLGIVIPALRNALNDPQPEVRWSAAFSLNQVFGDENDS